MKLKNIKWIFFLAFLPFLASCSWEDLPSYEDADINAVQFRYRWASSDYIDDITGEPLVLEMQLSTTYSIDANAGTVDAQVTVPAAQSYFTQSVRDQVTVNNICCQVTLSTAARIEPVDGNKVLGIPDNWSSPHKFVVTAADGTKKTWTISVTSFNK